MKDTIRIYGYANAGSHLIKVCGLKLGYERAYNDRRRAKRALSELQPSYTGRVIAVMLAVMAVLAAIVMLITEKGYRII